MARPNGNDERDSEFGYGRTQPEFSLGERMATMEAQLGVGGNDQMDKLWAILATLAAVVLTIVLVVHGG